MCRRGLRATVLGAALLTLSAAGCGGGDDDGGGPLDAVLGYLPKEAPLVVSMETDLDGAQGRSARRVLDRLPFSGRLLEGLERAILGDVDFDREVRPLLGNEFVVGAVDPGSVVSDDADIEFVGAIEASGRNRLEAALERGGARARGERAGAKLYEDSDGDTFAVKEKTLVVASERGLLEDALARQEGGDGLEQAALDDATSGLGEQTLVRGFADVQGLLAADPDTAGARRVKWVSALRKLGFSASAAPDRVDLRFRMATEPGELSDEDLPIAPGGDSPSVVAGGGEVDAGLRDPAHTVAFAEAAARAVDAGGFGQYALGKRALERALGVDLERDLLGQLEDDLSLGVDFEGGFGARAAVKDPGAFRRTLDRLRRAVPGAAERIAGEPLDFAEPTPGRPFYVLSTRDGDEIAVYGMVQGVFVVATDAERAGRLARERPAAVDGARGAVAASAEAARLVPALIGSLALGDGGTISGRALGEPLGEARGSLASSREGLEGRFSMTVR